MDWRKNKWIGLVGIVIIISSFLFIFVYKLRQNREEKEARLRIEKNCRDLLKMDEKFSKEF
jgi:heme/copper-type cytochrome/quinol oxidase subunit 2